MTKLAEAIAKTVEAAKSGNDAELGTSIVDIVSSGVGLLGKVFGL
ncbi:beta-class phenol-soluble modulin [Staphylococcus gallinarum]|uniref:Beta-class phenol-soluble modulin n=1 Tax=Staphylococcus gallinarum TaxID=1293 RepID=A0A3A0VMX1_STAGA|nr:beta-class phenol-soluble modulin [Staphylococcus gallinarum]RIP33612.1 beta-class phenol-soluble modulin [Staphylococcus gallinarum]